MDSTAAGIDGGTRAPQAPFDHLASARQRFQLSVNVGQLGPSQSAAAWTPGGVIGEQNTDLVEGEPRRFTQAYHLEPGQVVS